MSWIEKPETECFGNLNISALSIDQAYLNIFSSATVKLWLFEASTNCHSCAFKLVKSTKEDYSVGNAFKNITIDTKYAIKYRLRTSPTPTVVQRYSDDDLFCQREYHFGEFGVYNWNVTKSGCEDFEVALEPMDILLPLLLNIIIYGALWTIFLIIYRHADRITSVLPSLFKSNSKRRFQSHVNVVHPRVISRNALERQRTHLHLNSVRITPDPDQVLTPVTRKRLRSLDTFRGLSVVLMVFVTYEGGSYHFFQDASWDGLNLASLPFPWLLWTMGMCIPISIQYNLKQGTQTKKICKKIIIRTVKLFLTGYVVMSVWEPIELKSFRLLGVLQRYAVCYLVCALLLFALRGDLRRIAIPKEGRSFRDLTIGWLSWIIVTSLVVAHVMLTKFLPVPGCPKGYVGAAGLANDGKYAAHCVGGAASYIDRKLLFENHLYKSGTSKEVYQTGNMEPEGLLGNLTAIFQTWLGVQAGITLLAFKNDSKRLKRFLIWSVFLGAAGGALCQFQWTDGFIPMNKNLWSLSYVLVTSGSALLIFGVMYYLVDVLRLWSGSPFYESGMNALFIYFGHYMTFHYFPWSWKVGNMNSHFIRLFECLWGVSVWIIAGIWLKHKKVLWKF